MGEVKFNVQLVRARTLSRSRDVTATKIRSGILTSNLNGGLHMALIGDFSESQTATGLIMVSILKGVVYLMLANEHAGPLPDMWIKLLKHSEDID
jgi:hypothetical protein